MGNAPQESRPDGLDARLRALRREHPTLAVLTELIHLDDQRITFRATVRIDGEARAQGHAARCADPAGAFVAEAERLAVEQALLLGGFGVGEALPPASAEPPSIRASPPLAGATPPAGSAGDGPAPTAPRPPRPAPPTPAASAPAAPEADGAESDRTAILAPVPLPASPAATIAAPEGDALVAPAPPPADTRPDGDIAGMVAIAAEPPRAARRKRDRAAERERARSRQAAALPGEPPEPSASQARRAGPDESEVTTGSIAPEPAPAPPADGPAPGPAPTPPATPPVAATRPPRARATAAAVPDAPATHEAIRAAWRAGRPIPAWWPPERVAVAKRLPKAQVERLRAVALDEEMTATQLDNYSTLLFGSVVAELNQAQAAILEERLNPAYPSPLEELRHGRVLHPIAVGDGVAIPAESAAFIRWRDVPVVAEPMPAPSSPSWRAGGTRRRR